MNPHIGRQLLKRMGWSSGQAFGKNNDGSLQPLASELIEKHDRFGLESSLDRSAPSLLPIVVLLDGLQPPWPAPPVVADAVRRCVPASVLSTTCPPRLGCSRPREQQLLLLRLLLRRQLPRPRRTGRRTMLSLSR